jgi:predicted nucleotidyltransferase component of viral defense system
MQDRVAAIILKATEKFGFALAGGKALQSLGLTTRPTEDLDIFLDRMDTALLKEGVSRATKELVAEGYEVEYLKMNETFVRMRVTEKDGTSVDVDCAYDYRELPPVTASLGSTVSKEDVILNKVSALYCRSLPRDFIDLHHIREAGFLSDDEIIRKSQERDDGFVVDYFIDALRSIRRMEHSDFAAYGVTENEYARILETTTSWADTLERAKSRKA